MTAKDHNKTLVIIYTVLGVYATVPVLAAPWIITNNSNSFSSPRSGTQVLIATVAAIIVLVCLAVLLLSTAYSLYKRKQRARKWAIISAIVVFPLFPPITVYTWWFMHSDAARNFYSSEDN